MPETGFNPDGLRDARDRAGLTRKQLADAIGCGYSTVACWEHGVGYPPTATLNLIAKVLDIHVVDLFAERASA